MMTLVTLAILLYFLPTIIGHNKRHVGAIFLLNFFLGWTIVGWLLALIWACTPDPRPVHVYGENAAVHYCSGCGKPQFAGVNYCSACGRAI